MITGRIPPWKAVRCIDCGVKDAMQAARDMYNHEGEWYDRWLKSAGPNGRPPKQQGR